MKLIQPQLARPSRLYFLKQILKQRQNSRFLGITGSRNISGTAVRQKEQEDNPFLEMAKGQKFDLKVPKGTKDCTFRSHDFVLFRRRFATRRRIEQTPDYT
jgi:hypothetical protein